MVGPGEVDEELEPEVKEECEQKYGEIVRVKIVEVPNVVDEETVRIFLEFKRVESAIKGETEKTFFIILSFCVFFQLWLISMEDSLVVERFKQVFTMWKIYTMINCYLGSFHLSIICSSFVFLINNINISVILLCVIMMKLFHHSDQLCTISKKWFYLQN
jgi:hypothetical protein